MRRECRRDLARRQRKSLRERHQPLPRPAPAAAQAADRRAERHRRGADFPRQRQRRGDRPGLPHLLRPGTRQRRVDLPHLRHVPRGGRHERRGAARSATRRGVLAAGRGAARRCGRAHETPVALLAEQPHGQRLSRRGDRTAARRIRRDGGTRRSLHRLRRRTGIPAAPRGVPEPDRPADLLESLGHGGPASRAGLRLGTRRGTFRKGQIPLQHQHPRTGGGLRTARMGHRRADRPDSPRTRRRGRSPRRGRLHRTCLPLRGQLPAGTHAGSGPSLRHPDRGGHHRPQPLAHPGMRRMPAHHRRNPRGERPAIETVKNFRP